MRSPASLRLGLATLSLAFIACGGAAHEPKSPPASKDKDVTLDADGPSSVAEAQDQIARAKRELEHAAVTHDAHDAKTSDSSAPPAPPPADSKSPKKTTTPTPVSPSTPPRSEARPGQAPQDGVASKHEDVCGNPCKAITSMRRAVSALCRMTGEEDGRCVDAKRTLASSEARVASCPCAKN